MTARLGRSGKGNGMPHNALKALPAFKTEEEERTFWQTHDATDYLDLSKAQRVKFSSLMPSVLDDCE